MEENKDARRFSRTSRLLGKDALERLARKRVAVFGVGGVGGYAAEALARTGIGAIDLIDSDTVSESNINRQIIALTSTIGKNKVDVMKERILDINPNCQVTPHLCFYLPETKHRFDFCQYDYIVDAVDTVTAKIALVMEAQRCHTPIISSMGAGNKLDPTMFEVADIYSTSVCPLAKVIRRELKKRGILSLKVVYSREQPLTPMGETTQEEWDQSITVQPTCQLGKKKVPPGSIAFVPSAAGLILAGEVITELVEQASAGHLAEP